MIYQFLFTDGSFVSITAQNDLVANERAHQFALNRETEISKRNTNVLGFPFKYNPANRCWE